MNPQRGPSIKVFSPEHGKGTNNMPTTEPNTTNVQSYITVIGDSAIVDVADSSIDSVQEIQEQLQKRYINHFSKWNIPRIKDNKEFEYIREDRDSLMVDLCIFDENSFRGIHRSANELSWHLRLRRQLSNLVCQHEIVDPKFRCNVLTGVAGIGKTTVIENIALSWARNPMYFGKGVFRFVFLFSCRKLNEYRRRKFNLQQLFEAEFNIRIQSLSKIDGSEVLIIIDGIDEIDSLVSLFDTSKIDAVYELLQELIKDQSCYFPGHTTLLTGRPHTMPALKRFQYHTGPIRFLHIQGFNSHSVSTYIQRYCHNDETMAKRIIDKIEGSLTIKAMATVPQLLSSICSIYSWGISDVQLEKKTELFVWVFISLLKHQFPQYNGMLPHQLMSEGPVKKFFSAISKISYDLMLDNRILFEESCVEELGRSDPLLNKLLDAFILKADTKLSSNCQFTHLIIKEFFAAVHCYTSGISVGSLLGRELYEVAEFYVGFASADQSTATDNDIVALFIRNIPPQKRRSFYKSKPKKPSVLSIADTIFSFWEGWKVSCDIFCSLFYELMNTEFNVPECITFPKHADIILSGQTSYQVIRLNHFLTRMLTQDDNFHGRDSFTNVTITINHTDFPNNSEITLCLKLLRSFKEVSFISCSFAANTLKHFFFARNAGVRYSSNGCGSPLGLASFLTRVSFKECDLSDEDIAHLAMFIPGVQNFSIESVNLNFKAVDTIVREILNESYSTKFKLKFLSLRDCSLDDFCIETLCKSFHLIETIDLSGNFINNVRIDMLIRRVKAMRKDGAEKFCLKTLILRDCSTSPALVRQLKKFRADSTRVNVLFD